MEYVIDDKWRRRNKMCRHRFVDDRLGLQKIREKLITTLGDDAHRLSQIKV
jgi:hypothetical protein